MILFILQQCGWCSFVLIYGGVDGGGGGGGLYFYLSLILLISLKKTFNIQSRFIQEINVAL